MQKFINNLIREAGAEAMKFFGTAKIAYSKESKNDIVTHGDLAVNKLIIDAIRAAYPDHGIVSEEMPAHNSEAEYVWYIDPIDGTRNFASRVPLFGVMIGLAHNSEMQHAAIYLPTTDELCVAEKNKGAYLNDKRIYCTEEKDWEVSYGVGPAQLCKPKSLAFVEKLAKISNGKAWASGLGSCAVSAVYVADGRRDWYRSSGGKVWDYAIPSLILREAGCVVTNFQGEDWKIGHENMIASNKYLHAALATMVA